MLIHQRTKISSAVFPLNHVNLCQTTRNQSPNKPVSYFIGNIFPFCKCVASIAAAELPQNGWVDLLPTLLANVENTESTYQLKEASLEAIGYMCQDIVSIGL